MTDEFERLARQLRADVFQVFLEQGDEIIEKARNHKSIKPAELTNLTNLLAILRAAK
jgi:hypothetical protein